jgi:hypothetical protein
MAIFNIRNVHHEWDEVVIKEETDENDEKHEAGGKMESVKEHKYPKALNAFCENSHEDTYKDRYDQNINKITSDEDYEEELIFLINTAEQCKRPKDMLKFIGHYFKCSILQSDEIHLNKAG